MLLFETKLILPPFALFVMVPVALMPVLLPAALLFAVTLKLLPPALIVIAPVKLTTVVAVVDVPLSESEFADMATALVMAVVVVFELAVIDTAPALFSTLYATVFTVTEPIVKSRLLTNVREPIALAEMVPIVAIVLAELFKM